MTYAHPQFITFTGADDNTRIEEMSALSRNWSVEFGILIHHGNTRPRYPSQEWLAQLIAHRQSLAGLSMRLAAHICGSYSKTLMEMGKCPALEEMLSGRAPTGENVWGTIQINTRDARAHDPQKQRQIADWAESLGIHGVVFQSGDFDTFPATSHPAINYLFDKSGGRGVSPVKWPTGGYGTDVMYGFAGGLNIGNIQQAAKEIGAGTEYYWLDLETGCRNRHDQFDLSLCQQMCEMVMPGASHRSPADANP